MDKMMMLKDTLYRELDEIADKGTISAGDLESAFKIIMAIKGLYKIEMYEENDSYDGGMWKAHGGYSSRAEYSERRRRDAMGRYSKGMHESKHEMAESIREMMQEEGITRQDREVLEKAMRQLLK